MDRFFPPGTAGDGNLPNTYWLLALYYGLVHVWSLLWVCAARAAPADGMVFLLERVVLVVVTILVVLSLKFFFTFFVSIAFVLTVSESRHIGGMGECVFQGVFVAEFPYR